MRVQNVKVLSGAELRQMLMDCIKESILRTLCRDDRHKAKEKTFNPPRIRFMNECPSCGLISWPECVPAPKANV